MKLTRFIPQGYNEFKPEIGDYKKDLFACYANLFTNQAIFFTGKQSKPTWHYKFHTVDQMKDKIKETVSRLMSWEDKKVERKEERKNTVADIKVGDLYCSSWGYDQTNVDFYQVTEVKGKSFTIKEIASKTVEGSAGDYGGMADRRVAVKDAFLDETKYPPLTKRSLKLNSYSWLSKTTENEEHYCSWYA